MHEMYETSRMCIHICVMRKDTSMHAPPDSDICETNGKSHLTRTDEKVVSYLPIGYHRRDIHEDSTKLDKFSHKDLQIRFGRRHRLE